MPFLVVIAGLSPPLKRNFPIRLFLDITNMENLNLGWGGSPDDVFVNNAVIPQ
jgi:hypothetical protein